MQLLFRQWSKLVKILLIGRLNTSNPSKNSLNVSNYYTLILSLKTYQDSMFSIHFILSLEKREERTDKEKNIHFGILSQDTAEEKSFTPGATHSQLGGTTLSFMNTADAKAHHSHKREIKQWDKKRDELSAEVVF